MIRVLTVEQMRAVEAAADAAGLSYDTMMQNAGRTVAHLVLKRIGPQPEARVTVLVGPGNNGGDGLVAGRIIAQESSAQVRFYLLKPRDDKDANFKAVQEAGLFMALADDDKGFRVLRNMVASADVVIDALFGIGVHLPVQGEAGKVLRSVRQALNETSLPGYGEGYVITPTVPETSPRLVRPYVVAVDCPSGLESDTGEVDANTIPADETVTFIAAKPGLLRFPGAGLVGELHVATIGVPEDLPQMPAGAPVLADAGLVRALLPERSNNSNKGTFGKALIVAGSVNYVGAAGLSAQAAYRIGAGLVTVGAPGPVVAALCGQILEPTWLLLPHDLGVLAEGAAPLIREELGRYNALLLGPGWGRESATRAMLLKLFEKAAEGQPAKRAIGFSFGAAAKTAENQTGEVQFPPLVLDADGLNLLSEVDNWWSLLPANTVITPHPGEMARLAKLEISQVQAQRFELAKQKAAEWNVVLLLKGAHTLVAEPGGRVVVLPFKTDALATAGTGDVLAGAIAGLLAQGLTPFDAAVVGAYLHGLAGMQAATGWGSTRSVVAGDVLEALGGTFWLLEAD
ncbi:MAG TPA: NAD(P)H-hydrate dehydratase [Phototrophicaceae bacterium]|nr:NAD(P)H-hydrate dehydratase [Phototrophicaceae bacterium]